MERATTMDRFDEKIIGYESIKNILRQILDTLKRPELYKSKGASIPRGLLMESDPGLGKSLLATVFIKESGRKSYVFRKTSQENSFLGVVSPSWEKKLLVSRREVALETSRYTSTCTRTQ